MLIATFTQFLGVSVLDLGTFIVVTLILSLFFSVYFAATSVRGANKVNQWLNNNSKRDKWVVGIICLIFTIGITILFLKTNASH
jgi:uncharacterized membrane protein HdeD (DUF308 family)